jgi:kynurenine formamidase
MKLLSDPDRLGNGRNLLGIAAVFFAVTACENPMNEVTTYDISIPLVAGEGRASAWYVPAISIEPVRANGFVGSVAEGGSVNFRDITFNPHGHGTHTECLGHITETVYSINSVDIPWLMPCELITVTPREIEGGDRVIDETMLASATDGPPVALVIRTLPNEPEKTVRNWSNTNPPYLTAEAAKWLVAQGVEHLLLDLPSVDREVDGGALTAHHVFWGVPEAPRMGATITELVYVKDEIPDGRYDLNLQTAPFVNDATPSRPLLIRRN